MTQSSRVHHNMYLNIEVQLEWGLSYQELLFIQKLSSYTHSPQPKSSLLARENCTAGHTSWLRHRDRQLPSALPKEQGAGPPHCPPLHMLPSTQGAGSSPVEPTFRHFWRKTLLWRRETRSERERWPEKTSTHFPLQIYPTATPQAAAWSVFQGSMKGPS